MSQNITFDAHETAAYLGVHYETVLRMSRHGDLPHHRIGRKLLFRKESLDAWIQKKEQESIMSAGVNDAVTFYNMQGQ